MIANTSLIFYGALALAGALYLRSVLRAKTTVTPVEQDTIADVLDTMEEGVVEGSKRLVNEPVIIAPTSHEHAVSAPITEVVSNAQRRLVNIYIAAKPGESFVGYELLQTLLSAGLRFGEMNIFHYMHAHAPEEAVFSLACAQEPGTFDLERIGGFSCRGLCLFYQGSMEESERWNTMLQVASQIAQELDGLLLDDNREPLSVPAELASFDTV